MAFEHWLAKTAEDEEAEYFYNQTDTACWALKNVGDHLQTRSPAKRDLTRKTG
jgi:hypothetical protein